MRVRLCLLTIAVGLATTVVVSCTSKPVAVQKPADVSGKWYGKLTPTAGSSVDTSGYAETAFNTPVELDLADGHFKLSFAGPPLEGSYKVAGDAITLQPESIMGQPLPEGGKGPLEEALGEVMAQMKEPIPGTIRDGGSRLYFAGKKERPGDADMTFTRDAPKDVVGPKSVKAAEQPFVGNYVFDESYAPPVAAKSKDPKEVAKQKAQEFVRNMAASARLSLKEDNTFVLDLTMRMEGKWNLQPGSKKAKDRIVLKVTGPKQLMDMTGGLMPDMPLEVASKRQLLMLNDKTGKADFAFKRK